MNSWGIPHIEHVQISNDKPVITQLVRAICIIQVQFLLGKGTQDVAHML